MKGLMLLADGFEDVEALASRDVLVRAGIEIVTSSIKDNKEVTTSHGVKLFTDISSEELNDYDSYDFIVLPGGGRGVENLLKWYRIEQVISKFAINNKLICAICAAPMVLGKCGLLTNKRYTCYAGCNVGLEGEYTASEIEIDDNILTGRSMLFSVDFGLAIIEYLLGKEKRDLIYRQIEGLNHK